MPNMLRGEILEENQPYHILSRAVEKRPIFDREEDSFRFILQMYAANVGRPVANMHRKDVIRFGQALLENRELPTRLVIHEHPLLVNLLSFALVKDHYHFCLVSGSRENIPKYMHRLNIGYAKYFNLKYGRKGTLFESRYKLIPVQSGFQLDALLRYLNVINPLDVYQPGWREQGLDNSQDALRFLNNYLFSSFPDLFGKRRSKILAPRDVVEKFLGKEVLQDATAYLELIESFLKERSLYSEPVFLE